MEKEYVFSDLAQIVNEKNNISADFCEGKWRVMEYSTGKYDGQMLVTTEEHRGTVLLCSHYS